MTETSRALTVLPNTAVGLTDGQKALLTDKLDPAFLKRREQGGQTLTYIEGWRVIERANVIFGHDGWDRETIELTKTVQETYPKTFFDKATRKKVVALDEAGEPIQMHRVGYLARVRITVRAGEIRIVREGTGYGQGVAQDPNMAFEGAVKEAETDATKRAMMTLGDQFGLTLYDKEQRNVDTPAYVIRAEAQALAADQLEQLRDLIAATQSDEAAFVQHVGKKLSVELKGLEDIPSLQFEVARQLLLAKRKSARRVA
jgi:recombination DNA repair RAD52 pathway protein